MKEREREIKRDNERKKERECVYVCEEKREREGGRKIERQVG